MQRHFVAGGARPAEDEPLGDEEERGEGDAEDGGKDHVAEVAVVLEDDDDVQETAEQEAAEQEAAWRSRSGDESLVVAAASPVPRQSRGRFLDAEGGVVRGIEGVRGGFADDAFLALPGAQECADTRGTAGTPARCRRAPARIDHRQGNAKRAWPPRYER